ncbi:S1/P1 nuclease [Undibacterium sp. 14-3-2]|uniref:S1/P1 nuclease n=1 Tax=Undibacterium sp. 14-3-2 TaxID=2800129 RepID=UPI0019063320|nr:S1/P1 nuclease [Undibacterium sp. 14-3-2]MBK1889520.1 S1/P1 nuclease [Undibacterium sp. 14-3-2]
MKKIFISAMMLCATSLPQLSFAWGADGHQTVGAIADQLLSGTKAGAQVKALLGDNTLEKMAVWGDCVKGISPEKDYAYTSAGRYPECAPFENPAGIAAMADYVRRNNTNCNPAFDEENCHKQYHYADVALQHDHYKTGYVGTSDHDVVNAIRAAALVLQGKPQPKPFAFKDKQEALALLTHYVGDIHQPLHVGSVFLNAEGKIVNPDEGEYDRGSNTVGGNALQCPCGNLHSLWDDLPQQFKRGRMNEALTKKARTLNVAKAQLEQLPALWADDAVSDAKKLFAGTQFSKSTPNQRGNSWSIALPLEYEKTMVSMKEDALVRAGAHLAQILQTVWPE